MGTLPSNPKLYSLLIIKQVLGKEVGEGINVSSLLGTNSGWRGRAQQIIVLQNKVHSCILVYCIFNIFV